MKKAAMVSLAIHAAMFSGLLVCLGHRDAGVAEFRIEGEMLGQVFPGAVAKTSLGQGVGVITAPALAGNVRGSGALSVLPSEASPGTPQLVHRPTPVYPRLSRMKGEEGEVSVRARIAANGHVLEAVIAKSSGYPRLDESALVAAREAVFEYATENSGSSMSFVFKLSEL